LLDPHHHDGVERFGAPVPVLAAIDVPIARALVRDREGGAAIGLRIEKGIDVGEFAAPIEGEDFREGAVRPAAMPRISSLISGSQASISGSQRDACSCTCAHARPDFRANAS